MSTSIILLDQNSNANDVDIMVVEHCVLFPPCGRLGGSELEPGHDFLPEPRPGPVSKILTRPDIFEHFNTRRNCPETNLIPESRL